MFPASPAFAVLEPAASAALEPAASAGQAQHTPQLAPEAKVGSSPSVHVAVGIASAGPPVGFADSSLQDSFPAAAAAERRPVEDMGSESHGGDGGTAVEVSLGPGGWCVDDTPAAGLIVAAAWGRWECGADGMPVVVAGSVDGAAQTGH